MKCTRRILIAVIILTGLITALWWEENWRGQKIWEESCARLRAAGEPVDIADIIPPRIPDEENVAAAPIFAEVFKDKNGAKLMRSFLEGGLEEPGGTRLFPPKARPFQSGDDSLIREWHDYLRKCLPSLPPIPEGLSAAGTILFLLSDFDGEWEAVSEAVRRPHCQWPIDYSAPSPTKGPPFQAIQRFRHRAEPRMLAFASRGDWKAYGRGICTMLELSRHLMSSATGVSSQVVSIGFQGLSLRSLQNVVGVADFSEVELRSIQDQVSKFTLKDALPAMRAERVANTSLLLRLKSSELRQCLDWSPDLRKGYPQWLDGLRVGLISNRPHGWKLAEAATFQDRWVLRLQSLWDADGLSVDWQALTLIESELAALNTDSRWLSLDGVTASPLSLQVTLFKKLVERQALANSIEAWCAVQRFRLHHGRLPDKLEDLRPAYLAKVPVDPIDGQALRYAMKSDDSFIVYSIGWNKVDDGGRSEGGWNLGDSVWASKPALLNEATREGGQPDPPTAEGN